MTRTPPAERPLPDQERLFADVLTRLDLSDVTGTTRVTEVTRTRPHRRLTQVVGTAAAAAVVVAGVAVVSHQRGSGSVQPGGQPAASDRIPSGATVSLASSTSTASETSTAADLALQTGALTTEAAVALAQRCAAAGQGTAGQPTPQVDVESVTYGYALALPSWTLPEQTVSFTDPTTHLVYGCVARGEHIQLDVLAGPAATLRSGKQCDYPPSAEFPVTPTDSFGFGPSGAGGWFRVGPTVDRLRERVTLDGQAPGPWVSSLARGGVAYLVANDTRGDTAPASGYRVEIQAVDAEGALLTPPPAQSGGCVLVPSQGMTKVIDVSVDSNGRVDVTER